MLMLRKFNLTQLYDDYYKKIYANNIELEKIIRNKIFGFRKVF